jgi:diaminopimelate decarboxylase
VPNNRLNAGIFVTKVEFLKQNSEHAFAIVDGAMNDLLRPSFYNAYHQVLPIYCLFGWCVPHMFMGKKLGNGFSLTHQLVGGISETTHLPLLMAP